MPEVKAKWISGLEFSVLQDGHTFSIDGDAGFGGRDRGPRPKNLLLSALAGCTGMDVVSILRKMKIENYSLEIRVSGELTDEHPKVFHKIDVAFLFTGDDLPPAKLRRAVALSRDKYCGVSAMLKKTADISYAILINGEET